MKGISIFQITIILEFIPRVLCIYFIHSWTFRCFYSYILTIAVNSGMRIRVQIFFQHNDLISLEYILRSRIASAYDSSVLSFEELP